MSCSFPAGTSSGTAEPLQDSVVRCIAINPVLDVFQETGKELNTLLPRCVFISAKLDLEDFELQFLCKAQKTAPDSPKFIPSDLSLNPGNSQYSSPIII